MTIEELQEEIKGGKKIVKIGASWCGPCRTYDPILEELSNENKDIKVIHIDADENSSIAQYFGVRSIPFSIFYKDGEELSRYVGVINKTDLLARFE